MSYIIHGQLQDVIDYSSLIKAQANCANNTPIRVVKSRKRFQSKTTSSKSMINRFNIKRLSK